HHPATSELSPLSLHDALPIFPGRPLHQGVVQHCDLEVGQVFYGTYPASSGNFVAGIQKIRVKHVAVLVFLIETCAVWDDSEPVIDRKSTRLNSSHEWISYAVF